MNHVRKILCAVLFCASLGSAAGADEVLPDGPFKTVHLMIVTPVQEAFLLIAVKDFNQAFAKEGCSSCVYRAFKMAVGKPSKYNYMMTADWPSSDMYLKMHASPAFTAAYKHNPILDELSKTEFYGRYVEMH
jgi:hypothetical protein